jgi:multiple sugar transport system permease protein
LPAVYPRSGPETVNGASNLTVSEQPGRSLGLSRASFPGRNGLAGGFGYQAKWAYIFMLPTLLLFVIFTIVPIVAAFLLSFQRWDVLTPPVFIGLQNYQQLLNDALFLTAARNTAFYTAGVVPITILISLVLALLLNRPIGGRGFIRTAIYLPLVTSGVAVASAWTWIYNPDFGVLNAVLGLLGLPAQGWLTDPITALPCLIIIGIWRSTGWATIIFLAGLQGIPGQLYEAATVDGAGRLALFRHITIPMLAPTTFFVLVMSIIGSFQIFDLVYLTTRGGPLNATTVVVQQIYNNGFLYLHMGYASAMAIILFIIIFVLSLLSNWFFRAR